MFLLSLILSFLTLSALSHSTQEPISCDPNNRLSFCNLDLSPVCAIPTGCNSPTCGWTALSPCEACQDPSTDHFYNGECTSKEEESLEEEGEQVDKPLNLEFSGQMASLSFSETPPCTPLTVIVFIKGKYVEGNFCCPVGPGNCPNNIEPVCGSLFSCIGSVCRQSKRNACQACLDPNVKLYFPGSCHELFGDAEEIFEEEEESSIPEEEEEEEDDLPGEYEDETEYNNEGEGVIIPLPEVDLEYEIFPEEGSVGEDGYDEEYWKTIVNLAQFIKLIETA